VRVNLLAAIAVGVCCALTAATLTGSLPRRRRRRQSAWWVRRQARVAEWLQQAGVGVGPAAFLWGSALTGVFALLVTAALTGSVFVALVPAFAVALLPRAYFGRRRRARLRDVQRAWPDGLRDILASISAGLSLTQAVNTLAVTGPSALRTAFARFPELARVVGTAPALELIKDDLADPTSDRVIEVLVLAHERGGAIVRDILEDLVTATSRDIKLLDEIDTAGLEMRINARAVMVLPWLVLVALTAHPGAFRDFYRSSGGLVTLLLAAGLTVAGVVVLSRLAREPGEARPFAGEVTS
jgi:tight adherence protein B